MGVEILVEVEHTFEVGVAYSLVEAYTQEEVAFALGEEVASSCMEVQSSLVGEELSKEVPVLVAIFGNQMDPFSFIRIIL